MKLRILSLISVCFLIHSNIFSQWVQTNGPYGNLALIDLSERGFNHVSFDFMSLGINALANSDSCLYAGTDYGGSYFNRYFISNGKIS